jgi:glycosyltransferase involved in cell wall biosynthesis
LIVYSPDYSRNVQMMLPNKFFEYLMAGLPVLASQLDATAEVIKTYDVGQVISSLAPADVAVAINSMLAEPLALRRMCRNALTAAQHEFYWEKESQKLVRLYHDNLKR